MTLRKKYRRYAEGGGMNMAALAGGADPYAGLIQMGQQIQGTLVDSVFHENEFGHQNAIGSALKGNAQLGTIGAVAGYIKGKKQEKEDALRRFHGQLDEQRSQYNRSAAVLSANPALVSGRPGEELYASGGFLKNRYYDAVKATGGNLKPLSANSAEVQGPPHEQGGVDLPQMNSEVEGGESLQGNYVFSDRLGFAKIHRKLATAIGKVEQKPATPERINSLRRMNQQVEELKNQQEQIRQQYNLQ